MNLYLSMLGALVRSALVAAGTSGMISDDQQAQIAGGIMAAAAVLWSLWQKHRAHSDLRNAQDGY